MSLVHAAQEESTKNVMESNEDKKQLCVAFGLVKDNEGRVLLQRRSDPLIPDADGKWDFPGGRIEHGEDPRDAVKRECLEEVGCEIELLRMLPLVQTNIWKTTDGRELHVLVMCYEAKLIKEVPFSPDVKVSEIKWFSEEELRQLDTLRGIKEFLNLSKDE